MPRDIPVGNGRLLIAFNSLYEICDIYYPHVGMENHCTGHPFRFGVWVDDEFSWVRSDSWHRSLDYRGDSLVTYVRLENDALGLELLCADCVDFHESVFVRRVTVKNKRDQSRIARLFFHHDFNISNSDVGDTAYFDPATNSLIHYKAQRYFLMSSCTETMCGGFQYATGVQRPPQWEGTWRDAEDGKLSGNPIVQGAVDSVMGIECRLEAGGSSTLYYWIAAGQSYEDVKRINAIIHERGPEALIGRTHDYWRLWVEKEGFDLSVLPETIRRLFNRSLLILRTQIDNGGAILAANDSDILHFGRDTYSYMWPRDGALVARALDRAGYSEPARRFYEFCAKAIHKRGYLLHKYNPDGSPGSSWHPWIEDGSVQLPIQEDETALVIWALWKHFDTYRDIEFVKPLYKSLIKASGDFMMKYRDKKTGLPYPSYDLWEERRGILTFTTAAVVAGLRAAANFTKAFGETEIYSAYMEAAADMKNAMVECLYSEESGRFLRMLVPQKDGTFEEDATVDASLFGAFYFDVFEPSDPRIEGTMEAVRQTLWVRTPVGGIARYPGDSYQRAEEDRREIPGNPWFICTLWMAQYEIARARAVADLAQPLNTLVWAADHALSSGVLAEQVHPLTNEPLSVSPLTWSHATIVLAVLDYLEKMQELTVTNPEHKHYILDRSSRNIVSRIDSCMPESQADGPLSAP